MVTRLEGYGSLKTELLNQEMVSDIQNLMPVRYQLHNNWTLKYSLERDGASLRTLYDKVKPKPGLRAGYVLVIQESGGTIFGAYTNESLHVPEGSRYYGNGDCFLFRFLKGRFEAFPYTGVNDFVIYCTTKFLSLGGGDGHYGLWLDDDLRFGVSHRSLTFGNPPLSPDGHNFEVVGLEVWCL